MTDPCLLRDDYLGGRLADPDADAFETHAAACAACDDALLADDLGLSALADVTCPPAVVEAALTQARRARRAPDRGPVALRRVGVWVAPLALAATVAIALIGRPGDVPDPTAPAPTVIAEPIISTPAPTPPPEQAVVPELPAPPPSAPTVTPSPRPAVAAAPASTPPPSPPATPVEAEPTAAEIEAAARDLALAFALVDKAQTHAGDAVRDEVGDLSSTLDHALPPLP